MTVQRWYRGYLARREVGKLRLAAARIQAAARGKRDRGRIAHENAQAQKIQSLYRGRIARKQVYRDIQQKTCDLAATMVQTRLRSVIQRRRLRKTLRCAVRLQAAWRGYYVRRRFREEYDRKAQIIIQSRMFESKKVVWYLERERQVMRGKIAVFREWAHSAGKRRALARQRDAAAITIQRCFRGYLARIERSRLRNEVQRNRELSKFVELLRSHMSMVISEEKERHSLAFPNVRKVSQRSQPSGVPNRKHVRDVTASTTSEVLHAQTKSNGRRHKSEDHVEPTVRHRDASTGQIRRKAEIAPYRERSDPYVGRRHRKHPGKARQQHRQKRQPRVAKRSTGAAARRMLPPVGHPPVHMRKAEMQDAMALARLLDV